MAGRSYIPDVPSDHLAEVVKNGKFKATTDPKALAAADIIDICVPTPLRKTKDPDMTYVVQAVETTAAILKKGQLIILESTTYPGTTVEVVQPSLAAKGFTPGVDFYLAFSPERVDPGNPHYQTKNIPKVVGGINDDSTRAAVAFYSQVMDHVVPVSSPSVAEMVKLLENTFRAVNIGLVNELAMMCHRMDLDVWELIDAAKTYVGADKAGRIADADLRKRIIEQQMEERALRLTVARAGAESRSNSGPSAATSVLKNVSMKSAQDRSELMVELMGNQGLGWEGEGFEAAELSTVRGWLSGKAFSIFGGSHEIQNNIISKRILGLPELTGSASR